MKLKRHLETSSRRTDSVTNQFLENLLTSITLTKRIVKEFESDDIRLLGRQIKTAAVSVKRCVARSSDIKGEPSIAKVIGNCVFHATAPNQLWFQAFPPHLRQLNSP